MTKIVIYVDAPNNVKMSYEPTETSMKIISEAKPNLNITIKCHKILTFVRVMCKDPFIY